MLPLRIQESAAQGCSSYPVSYTHLDVYKRQQPRLPRVSIDKLFALRTVEDTFRIKEYINKNHPKSAILAGGGFIGLELAENLRELGMDVTIVQRPKQLMNPFDPDMASMIHNEMRKHGIKLVLGYTVEGFKEKDNGVEVLLKDNPSLQADMVLSLIHIFWIIFFQNQYFNCMHCLYGI